jgi:outer membrane protein OmpA-like peptidoglycan-associated protein
MKKSIVYILLTILVVQGGYAQYGFTVNNNLFFTEDPNTIPFGTLSIEPLKTVFSYGSSDTASYTTYSLYNTLRFNVLDYIELGVSIPFLIDRMAKGSQVYFSRGRGDILVNIKYNYPVSENFAFAISPYLSIPFGRTRTVEIDSARPDTMFQGGILRDFTTTSYDYGVKFIGGAEVRDFSFNLNYGYYSAYRHLLTKNPPEFHLLGASVTYNFANFTPFAELLLGFYSKGNFGKAPSYLSLGTKFDINPFLDAKFSIGFPLVKREPISPVAPDDSSYPGLISSFPNYNEGIVLSFGVGVKNIVYNKRSTAKLTVIVKDRSTQEFVENCRIKVGTRDYFSPSGVLYIPSVKSGVQNLKIFADGYLDVDKFVEIEGNTNTKIEVLMVKKSIPVVLRVKNSKMEILKSAVALVSVEEGVNTVMADSNGAIRYVMDRSKPLSIYVSAPGYLGENFYIDPSLERDSIVIDVVLKEEKDEMAILPIIYFDVGSYRIKKEFFPFLDIVGRYLVNHPGYKLEIIGHASAEGPERFNQVLSLRRAEACKKHLVMRYKIDPDRIIVKGFGKDVPAVPNKTEYQRSINRRAEFRLIPPEK